MGTARRALPVRRVTQILQEIVEADHPNSALAVGVFDFLPATEDLLDPVNGLRIVAVFYLRYLSDNDELCRGRDLRLAFDCDLSVNSQDSLCIDVVIDASCRDR